MMRDYSGYVSMEQQGQFGSYKYKTSEILERVMKIVLNYCRVATSAG